MSHTRTQIRAALATLLKAAATPAGDNVHPCRSLPLAASGLPAVLVYDDSERVEDPDATYPIRALEIKIECRVQHKDPDALEAALDALALYVEAAIEKDRRLGDLAAGCEYQAMDKDRDADGEIFQGRITLEYEVRYRAEPAAQALEDFEEFHGDYSPGGFTGTADTVELETS